MLNIMLQGEAMPPRLCYGHIPPENKGPITSYYNPIRLRRICGRHFESEFTSLPSIRLLTDIPISLDVLITDRNIDYNRTPLVAFRQSTPYDSNSHPVPRISALRSFYDCPIYFYTFG